MVGPTSTLRRLVASFGSQIILDHTALTIPAQLQGSRNENSRIIIDFSNDVNGLTIQSLIFFFDANHAETMRFEPWTICWGMP